MNAIAESINRLTIALNALRESVDRCDVSRRLPAKVPEPLKSIAEEMCSDVDMCDFDTAIVIMDRISSQCRRKVRLIDKMTSEIQKSSRPNQEPSLSAAKDKSS